MLLLQNNESMLKSNLFDLNGIKRLLAPSRCILLRVWTIIKTRARKYSVKACGKMCEPYKAYFGMSVGDQDKSWALDRPKNSVFMSAVNFPILLTQLMRKIHVSYFCKPFLSFMQNSTFMENMHF